MDLIDDERQIKKNLNKPKKRKRFKFGKEIITGFFLGLIIVMVLQRFFIIATIPSESMYPTLKVGDKLYIKVTHSEIKRGYIYTFNGQNKPLIKRCIGVAGDHIQVKNDDVYINGEKLIEPYVSSNIDVNDETKKVDLDLIVPEHKVFFLGDNRAFSYDARYWEDKFIDEKDIIGEATYRLYPFNNIGSLKHK